MNEKTTNPKSVKPLDEMRPEYDFSGAVRGKYYAAVGAKMSESGRLEIADGFWRCA